MPKKKNEKKNSGNDAATLSSVQWKEYRMQKAKELFEKKPFASWIIVYVYNNPNSTESEIWKGIHTESRNRFSKITQDIFFDLLDYLCPLYLMYKGGKDIRRHYFCDCMSDDEVVELARYYMVQRKARS